MQDLVKKINDLRELMKAIGMMPKQQATIVPALKPPSVKPVSMPSMSAKASPKIPGVEPPSGKDPQKVAQQLQNPRPKKPKMGAMLKFDKNGQWSLD